jgi:hypothetical protein
MHGGFDVQQLVGGRSLPQRFIHGERRLDAMLGAEYELRLTNPLAERVAVAVSVDGLNVLDARHSSPWNASKWVIHPHDTLALSGWQVDSDRARHFYFTTERDSYATRIGRPAEFGVISAVFYRERRPRQKILRHQVPEYRRDYSAGAAAESSAADTTSLSAAPTAADSHRSGSSHAWPRGRAATGIGRSVDSDVYTVAMDLDPHPVAVVTLRYDFRRPEPRPLNVPGFAPEPSTGHEWSARREERDSDFAPER